jgi:hypothetical protein
VADILVLFEDSANGAAALRRAAEAAGSVDGALVVVTLAGQDPNNCCCGPSPYAFNRAVREAASEDLDRARMLLGGQAEGVTFRLLAGQPEPPLASWVNDRRFDIVFVPRRRLAPGGHWAARTLRRSTAADVRLVG